MPKITQDRIKKMEAMLGHAIRYGSNAAHVGLITQSVSDHLPIIAKLPFADGAINMLSWNLLAEEHLYNNFINISGSSLLAKSMNNRLSAKENIYDGSMHHLFSELGQFLLKQSKDGEVKITKELLSEFIAVNTTPSLLARSRDSISAQIKTGQVEEARKALVEILCDPHEPHAHEYQLALQQSMELMYQIKADDGVLQWKNRFNKLKENPKAVKELNSQDILAFQECTNPKDIQSLTSKNMVFITHNLNPAGKSTDNAVLAFNADKFELVKQEGNPLKTNFEGKKPALYAKLRNKITGAEFIVGSIHHPGGKHDLRHQIIANVENLRGGDDKIPFYVAGDYNHTDKQFSELHQQSTTDASLYYPTQQGTMAGSDFGNVNEAIDAVMSDQVLSNCVSVSPTSPLARPANAATKVEFDIYPASQETADSIENMNNFKKKLNNLKSSHQDLSVNTCSVPNEGTNSVIK